MPITSLLPSMHIPPQTLPDFLAERSEEFKHRVVLINGVTDEEYTVERILTDSARIGNGLRANGVRKGTVVALFLPTCPEFLLVSLGSMRAGGIVSGANPAYTVLELTHFLEDNNARVVFTTESMLTTVKEAVRARDKQVKAIYVIDSPKSSSFIKPLSDLLKNRPIPVPCEPMNPSEDLCLLPFSSGTTGRPKGVMLTHKNLIAAILAIRECDPAITPTFGDCTVLVLPAFHIFGFSILLQTFLTGIKVVTMPKFIPEDFLAAMEKHKIPRKLQCTVLYTAPPVLLFITKHPMTKKYDLSRLKWVFTGSAPCGSELTSQFCQKLPNVEYVIQGWGMTECPAACTLHCPSIVKTNAASCGSPLPNVELKVIDLETGVELPAFKDGEICVRGPSIMKGYNDRPKETAEMLTPDGWLHTGDIGHYDDQRLVYIVDRKKELIKVKGFQVPPAELEDLLLSHPKIADAAVIGIPNERTGEAPRAYVVADGALTEAEVHQFVEGKVAQFKRLTGGVIFVKEIPKSPSGKILRRLLRDEAKAKSKL